MRHICPISGKDSLATALVQVAREPDLTYEFIYNDTFAELPETYAWLTCVEEKTGFKIHRIGKSLPEIIKGYGGFLPSGAARYCTKEAKIRPMEKWLGKDSAVIYYGLRADESRTGYAPVAGSSLTPKYPLQEMGIDLRGVYTLLSSKDLLPPAFRWHRLENAVRARLQSAGIAWESHFQNWEIDVLFAGRTRANCYFCFYQQMAELLWLLEAHPLLYWQMADFETDDYTWIKGVRLAEFAEDHERQARAFARKAKEVERRIVTRLQMNLFIHSESEITGTSCGLICGK